MNFLSQEELLSQHSQLTTEIEQLKEEIEQIKKEMKEGIDIDRRIGDVIKMKTYLQDIRGNTELLRIHATGSTMKKEKKANLQRTLKRQKQKQQSENNEMTFNVMEIRKQTVIDKIASEIEKLSREATSLEDESFLEEVTKLLKSLEEQLDTDVKVTDVNELLKAFDVNAIALRKASTLFKTTSRLFSLQSIVDETSISGDDEQERVTNCEKLTFSDITQKVSELAVRMEDAICLSAVILGQKHDDYSGDFFDVCSDVIMHISDLAMNTISLMKRLSEIKQEDDSIMKKYAEGLDSYYALCKTLIENEKEMCIKRLMVTTDDQIEELKIEFRTCDLEEIVRQTALKLRSYISHALIMAYSLAHLKPKEIDKFNVKKEEQMKKLEIMKKKKTLEFSLEKMLYKEKMVMVEMMALVVGIYETIVLYSQQTSVILKIKQTEQQFPTNDEKAEVQMVKGKIQTMNLNGIIDRLTKQDDSEFTELIISSYGSFTTSKELIQKLISAHEKGDKKAKENIYRVLKMLITKSFDDMSNGSETILLEYLKTVDSPQTNELKAQLLRKISIRELRIASLLIPPIDFYIPNEPFFPTQFLIQCESKEIARQLTMIDHALYKKVRRSELFEMIPQRLKRNKICRYTHILEMQTRIDEIANWVATTVLMFSDMNNRIAMLLKFVEIAEELENLNNYQSLAGICKGIELETVQRLSSSIKAIEPQIKHVLGQSRLLGFNTQSYKSYRMQVDRVKDACIPYLGPVLKDLRKIYSKYPSTSGVVNIMQKQEIMSVANNFLKYQGFEYGFSITEPLYTYLFDLSSLPIDNENFGESYQRKISILCEDSF